MQRAIHALDFLSRAAVKHTVPTPQQATWCESRTSRMWKPPTRGVLDCRPPPWGSDVDREDLVQGLLSETGLVNFDGSQKKSDPIGSAGESRPIFTPGEEKGSGVNSQMARRVLRTIDS